MNNHGRKPWSSEPYEEPDNEERFARQKLFYFGLLVILVFGVLSVQLARMQLVAADDYRARADTNRLRFEAVLPPRGLIYDSSGLQLVENVPSYSAAVVAADIPDLNALADPPTCATRCKEVTIALQDMTGVPAGEIEAVLFQRGASNDPFTPAVIKDNLTEEAAFSLREKLARLPGVRVVVQPQRNYLEGELLSHIMGFVGPVYAEDYERLAPAGYQLNDRVGRAGVELTYESLLRGASGRKAVEVDASGREISVIDSIPSTPGFNLVLSIDVELQRKVEEILRDSMGQSLTATAIVMDVHTGDILALVTLPTYDSNVFSGEIDEEALQRYSEDPAKPMLNHAISEMYAPGSTFKMITGLGALQDGIATAGTQITSPGYLDVENEYLPGVFDRFLDWRSDLGTMNFYRGLAMSSDVYYYYLSGGYSEGGQQLFRGLGAARLAEWARMFGLGEETGIDLPGESAGLVPDPAWKEEAIGEGWLLGDTYNFGIGQGYVASTPLQILLVTAAIANGGDVLIPHVVKELRDAEGNIVELARETLRRTLDIDPRNLDIMREAMRQVVDGGSGYTGAVPGITVAGKTGTAEFGEEIAPGRYKEHGWFTAYAPFTNPEIAVVVFHEQGNGSGTAAPTVARIMEYYFNEHNLVPEAAR